MKELLTTKSKTINVSYIVAAFGVMQVNLPMIQEQLGDYYGWIFIGVAVVYTLLRKYTTMPLSEK